MIVTTKDDVVRLSGALLKNQWLTIKAAAALLLQDYPQGIVIDCSGLTEVSEDGAKTFLVAVNDIAAAGARIVVATLPEEVYQVVKAVPGVRSQLPIAATVEEARNSLRLGVNAPAASEQAPSQNGVLIPILDEIDLQLTLETASKIVRDQKQAIHAVYFLQVARNLPIGAPLPEAEAEATARIDAVREIAARLHLQINCHVERVRDRTEGLISAVKTYQSGCITVGFPAESVEQDAQFELACLLLARAACSVVITRASRSTQASPTK
jgi:anti-anti-sigma regulatory factor